VIFPNGLVEKLVFLSDMDKFSAYTVNIEEPLGRGKIGIVVLYSSLKLQPEELQAFTIAHELAHLKLKHATTFSDLSLMKERELLDAKEADELAKAWLLR
jgi:Zn-dependent protease with chaperone function